MLGQADALESTVRAICFKNRLNFDSLAEKATSSNSHDRVLAMLKHASKLLIKHMDRDVSVVLSGWTLTESKLAPMEWASLLNLSEESITFSAT